jgi:hypothetical protein
MVVAGKRSSVEKNWRNWRNWRKTGSKSGGSTIISRYVSEGDIPKKHCEPPVGRGEVETRMCLVTPKSTSRLGVVQLHLRTGWLHWLRNACRRLMVSLAAGETSSLHGACQAGRRPSDARRGPVWSVGNELARTVAFSREELVFFGEVSSPFLTL